MKKFLLLFCLFWFLAPAIAAKAEEIRNFNVEIHINQDGSITVEEAIIYNFGSQQKHGIYRDIPFLYKTNKGRRRINISNISVTDGASARQFETQEQDSMLRIKVGDPNALVAGINKYVIKYTVDNAINFFKEHDELYWNVTGNDWLIGIEQAKAEIFLPQELSEEEIQTACYAGVFGSDNECVSRRYEYRGQAKPSSVVFINDRLKAKEGMTIVVGVPKGIIAEPSLFKKLLNILKANWIFILPLFALFFNYYLWLRKGRDPKGKGTIITQFEAPDDLSPAQIGTIVDEKVNQCDISAEIINLAVKGYIKISKIQKDGAIFKSSDYVLEKLKSSETLKNKHENKLLESLFADDKRSKSVEDLKKQLENSNLKKDSLSYKVAESLVSLMGTPNYLKEDKAEETNKTKKTTVKLSSLKDEFYKDYQEIKDEIYKELLAHGYFPKNPAKIRALYSGLGIFIIFLGWFTGPIWGFYGVASLAASGIIFIIFSFFMPAKTRQGVLAYEHILGLKDYLSTAEKDRIEFHNNPKNDPKVFEKLLPFAMVLGVEKAWAKQFEEMYKTRPNWYQDASNANFSAIALSNSLNSFSTKTNSTLSSRPSSAGSGGSGFSGGGSGGGFGGGGGGSW